MLCHSVCSCRWPFLSLRFSLVASENFATARPLGVCRSSMSRPIFPIRIALLTLIVRLPAWTVTKGTKSRRQRREGQKGRRRIVTRTRVWPGAPVLVQRAQDPVDQAVVDGALGDAAELLLGREIVPVGGERPGEHEAEVGPRWARHH